MKSSYKKLGIFLIVLMLIIIVPGIGNIKEIKEKALASKNKSIKNVKPAPIKK